MKSLKVFFAALVLIGVMSNYSFGQELFDSADTLGPGSNGSANHRSVP